LILYSVSDLPALEKLGYARAQARTDDGRLIELDPVVQEVV